MKLNFICYPNRFFTYDYSLWDGGDIRFCGQKQTLIIYYRDDHADFQLQSSLLPTQYNMGNTKQNNYFDMRDYHVLDGRHDRYDDLSQTPNRAPVKKPPLTPHR